MSLLDNAKTLRRTMTDAEQKLWYHLRAHRFMGLKFKRQKPIGHYVVDFACIEKKLIVELDGGQHVEAVEYDHERDAWLRSQGYTVLRFWNNELMNETESVLEQILLALSPRPLSRKRERGGNMNLLRQNGKMGMFRLVLPHNDFLKLCYLK